MLITRLQDPTEADFRRDFRDFEGPSIRHTGHGGSRLTDRDHKDDEGLSKVALAYRKAAPVLDAVWQMIGASVLGTLGGWWLDRRFGTAPWLLVAGAVLGVGSGMYAFIRAALGASRGGRGKT